MPQVETIRESSIESVDLENFSIPDCEPAADEHWDDINWIMERDLAQQAFPASKVKRAARERIAEAFACFDRGDYHLPTHLTKLEGKLRYEWARRKLARTSAASKTTTFCCTRRKATEDIRPESKAKKTTAQAAPPQLAPLDIDRLWGKYTLQCPYVKRDWPMTVSTPFELVMAIGPRSMWANFDLGIYSGVMSFDALPVRASHGPVWFKWRGDEYDGPTVCGDKHTGWLKFLGGGRVEGWLDHQSISFTGSRDRYQEAKPETEMCCQSLWDCFSEEDE
ncbi:hypothetical protein NM208_g6329 [Fusarium decemcellulare]|uniref:Uncharacterized protein n=1 Tax=Fusarium decemcellulare TaxID=57161 RepID=A0ACC1SDD9_9HYPO|nr:hypothetical protein NM208_g6329 [Fusarium decemcellulare]